MDWVSDLLDPGTDGNWPRYMTKPHPKAVGSYGREAEIWVRDEMRLDLRWFQRLALRRQLEHDETGALVWRSVIDSTPRRVGKSIRLRALSLWRIAHPELFGEQQTVLFTGKDLPICKEIHRASWLWAKSRGWKVVRGQGSEEVEAPDGSRWIVRSQLGVYGYPAGLGACDEAWHVPASVIREGLQPALLDRLSPQLLLTSTAHTQATTLMKRRITDALKTLDGTSSTLLMLWAADPDAEPDDQQQWKAASPYWDEARRELIADAWEDAVDGETEADRLEPDPVEGFRSQYLNIWPLFSKTADTSTWGKRVAAKLPPSSAPRAPTAWAPGSVGAIESELEGRGWGAAMSDGQFVEAHAFNDALQAVAWLTARAPSRVMMHDTVARQLGDRLGVLIGATVTTPMQRAANAVVRDDTALIDHAGDFAAHLAHVVARSTSTGDSIDLGKCSGAVAAYRTGAWAIAAARDEPPPFRIR